MVNRIKIEKLTNKQAVLFILVLPIIVCIIISYFTKWYVLFITPIVIYFFGKLADYYNKKAYYIDHKINKTYYKEKAIEQKRLEREYLIKKLSEFNEKIKELYPDGFNIDDFSMPACCKDFAYIKSKQLLYVSDGKDISRFININNIIEMGFKLAGLRKCIDYVVFSVIEKNNNQRIITEFIYGTDLSHENYDIAKWITKVTGVECKYNVVHIDREIDPYIPKPKPTPKPTPLFFKCMQN